MSGSLKEREIGLSAPRAKACADWRIGGLRIGAFELAISRPRTPSRPVFAGRFGISTKNGAEHTPRELRGPI
eukprot:6779685-Alexandrium_andersonii.AAC.1